MITWVIKIVAIDMNLQISVIKGKYFKFFEETMSKALKFLYQTMCHRFVKITRSKVRIQRIALAGCLIVKTLDLAVPLSTVL